MVMSSLARRTAAAITFAALAVVAGQARAADIPGNRSTKAVLPVGTSYTNGLFETKVDADWYRVQLKQGNRYSLGAISLPSGSKLTMRLYDNQVQPIRGVRVGKGGGFTFTAPRNGLFYVAVDNDFATSKATAYKVRIRNAPAS